MTDKHVVIAQHLPKDDPSYLIDSLLGMKQIVSRPVSGRTCDGKTKDNYGTTS
jgi:hypothetical protein